jgi:hypothetical protein
MNERLNLQHECIPDIDGMPSSALLTRRQVSSISGFSDITLKVWARKGKGPKITRVEGHPRFRVDDLRHWLSGQAA